MTEITTSISVIEQPLCNSSGITNLTNLSKDFKSVKGALMNICKDFWALTHAHTYVVLKPSVIVIQNVIFISSR